MMSIYLGIHDPRLPPRRIMVRHSGHGPSLGPARDTWTSSALKRSDLAEKGESFLFFILIVQATYDLRRCGTIYIAEAGPGGSGGAYEI
jgi:hypothetical protein